MSEGIVNARLVRFDFHDLVPIEIQFDYDGSQYVLTEASGGAAVAYRNAILSATEMKDGKPVAVKNMADADLILLSHCLFKCGPKGRQPVLLSAIKAWPNRVVKPLYEKVKEVSEIGLDEGGPETPESLWEKMEELKAKREALLEGQREKQLKNGLTPTEATSSTAES